MAKYKRKTEPVDASRWLKNGDHPLDNSKMIYPDKNSETQFEPFLSEGEVVRWYIDHYDRGGCDYCGKAMDMHGLIPDDDLVCPGDWVITDAAGRHYAYSHEMFTKFFVEIK